MASKRNLWLLWGAIWLLAAAFMAAQVGFWDDVAGVELEDVNVFEMWSDFIAANHALPVENTWQYPPGAAFLMLIPRLGGDFGESFVALMLLFDLAGLILLAALASRTKRDAGVWVWLLAMPLLFTLPVLRFDLVPTVFAIAALVVIHRRPAWFGALAGIGAMVKVWPIVVLLGEWDRRRLLIAVAAAIGAAALMFGVAGIALGDQTGFLSNQEARGLQVEAVAASPWQLRQIVTGEVPNVVPRFGTNEIGSGPADTVSGLLKWVSLAILIAAAAWWWARDRAIRGGRKDLTLPDVSRDFIFTVILLLVVASRVLSPQFMIWLLGLAAVVLTAGSTRLARPAWIVVGAIILTAGLYQSPANFVIRNLALLVAAIDASVAMYILLRAPGTGESKQLPLEPAVAQSSAR
jgi:glycosyl transferase family 87